MNELTTAITDWCLAGLSLCLLAGTLRGGGSSRGLRALFFASIASASAMGGWVHYLQYREETDDFLWKVTTAPLAGVALALWLIGMNLGRWPQKRISVGTALVWAQAILFAGLALWRPLPFSVVILNYLPATIFFFVCALRSARRGARSAALGVAATWVAAAVQALGLGLHPQYLDHNSLYHVVQAVGLVLLYRGWQLTSRE